MHLVCIYACTRVYNLCVCLLSVHVCVRTCVYVYMSACVRVSVSVPVCACMYVCVCPCMCVCVHMHVCLRVRARAGMPSYMCGLFHSFDVCVHSLSVLSGNRWPLAIPSLHVLKVFIQRSK